MSKKYKAHLGEDYIMITLPDHGTLELTYPDKKRQTGSPGTARRQRRRMDGSVGVSSIIKDSLSIYRHHNMETKMIKLNETGQTHVADFIVSNELDWSLEGTIIDIESDEAFLTLGSGRPSAMIDLLDFETGHSYTIDVRQDMVEVAEEELLQSGPLDNIRYTNTLEA